ncbi:MAG: ABC transporter substrate-binding protein, partial [Bacteroidales bacterium]|nr:ABC transporter substrate-binding protein [Bacteroidales bacterium]
YDKTAMADSIFTEIEKRYNDLKLKASQEVNRKRIMFGSDYNGTWYMPGGQSYKAQMVRDAGAVYNWFGNEETGSLPLSLEQVLIAHNQDDIWLEAPWRSFAEMLSTDSRLKEFKSVKEGKVFNNFGLSNGIANGYWETGVCRPDLVLQDMVKICYPKLVNQPLIFYQNLKIEPN